jgi:hypothetical protein
MIGSTPHPLMDAFHIGMHEADENWQALPQRLRGRGVWLEERGRIKDSELMYNAATEIEILRRAHEALSKRLNDLSFAAQTSGGLAGPDEFLKRAVERATS